MEAENAILTKAYEDEVEVSTNLKKQLDDADDTLKNIHINFGHLEASLDNLKNAKKQLERKHEQTCNDIKDLKSENEGLKKGIGKV